MNEKYMKYALQEALKAYNKQEIPVGAVIIDNNNKIIAKSHNNRQKKHKITGHAEINCILKAEKKTKDWRLDNCVMYVTLEPCEMCKLIIKESRIEHVFYLLKKNNEKTMKNTNFLQTNDCENIKKEYKLILESFFNNLRD